MSSLSSSSLIEGISDGVLFSTFFVILLMSATIYYLFEYLPATLAGRVGEQPAPRNAVDEPEVLVTPRRAAPVPPPSRGERGETFALLPALPLPAALAQLSVDDAFELAAQPVGLVLISAGIVRVLYYCIVLRLPKHSLRKRNVAQLTLFWLFVIADELAYGGIYFDRRARILLALLTVGTIWLESRIFTVRRRRRD